LGIEAKIEWVGAVEQRNLPCYYRAADVTVVPSTYESFGLVALESMACGTPVVAAAVGGLLATIQHGQTGFLVASQDPLEYAERIGSLLTDQELRQKLSAHAIERASQFGWRRVAAQLLELYQDLIFARRHGEPPATVWQALSPSAPRPGATTGRNGAEQKES
jgi:D-inositol-3-phosphate glycosyltransferase